MMTLVRVSHEQEQHAFYRVDWDTQRSWALSAVIDNAVRELPVGAFFEVRSKPYPADEPRPVDFGRRQKSARAQRREWELGWIVTEPGEIFQREITQGTEVDGYVLIARLQVSGDFLLEWLKEMVLDLDGENQNPRRLDR